MGQDDTSDKMASYSNNLSYIVHVATLFILETVYVFVGMCIFFFFC